MAAFNFPNSPSTNQVHTENNVTWKWNGVTWKRQGFNDKIEEGNTSAEVVDTGSDGHYKVTTEGTERLRIDDNGKILIATTTTSEAHANNDELIIGSTSDDNNHGLTIVTPSSKYGTVAFSDGSSGTGRGLLEYNHSGDYMRFYTAGSERVRIDSSGRLLLGTTTEGQGDADNLTIRDSGNCGITIRSSDVGWGVINFSDATSGAGEYDGFINYSQQNRFLKFGTASTERVRINSNGHVLIGEYTDNAFFKAHAVDGAADDLYVGQFINAEATAGRNYGVNIQAGSNNTDHGLRVKNHAGTVQFIIQGGGDVGVNITDPVAQLQVNTTKNAETDRHDATNYALALRNPADDNGEAIGLSFGITSNATKVGASILHERDGGGSTGSLQFYTSPDGNGVTERLRIAASGAFGLSGATYGSSGQVLTSAGSGSAPTWTTISGGIDSDSDSNTVGGTNAGNAGTWSGATSNTCFGKDAGTDLTDADGGTFFGHQAGANVTSGNNNVAVGYVALLENTTSTENTAIGNYSMQRVTGASNTAVGYMACRGTSGSSGTQNSAFGRDALSVLTSGNYNVAMGFEAGKSITSGGGNVFLGHKACNAGTTGTNNVAIGVEALKSAVGGIHGNVAIGYRALYQQNGDRYNTAVGYEAGLNIQGAHDIVAVGHQALKSLTSGAYNTAIGWHALESLQTGQRNTAVGRGALDNCVSGNDNTCMGIDAGMNTTSSSSVMIGTNAGRTNTTGDQNVYIGTYVADQGTDGSRNVCIGMYAMSSGVASYNTLVGWAAGHQIISNGRNNTCLGYAAGYGITDGHTNVCIGNEAGYGQIGSDDYELFIARGNVGPGSGSCWVYGDGSGNVIRAGNGTSWSQTSDRRIKKNIVDNTVGLDVINKIRIRNFEYKTEDEIDRTEFGGSPDDEKYTAEEAAKHDGTSEGDYYKNYGIDKSGVQLGVIAQELEEVLPNMVATNPKTSKKTTNTDELIWHLVNAVKELSAENTAMKERLDVLESS